MTKQTLEGSLEALSNVIRNQQDEIDLLKSRISSLHDATERQKRRDDELLAAAAKVVRWPKLREAWKPEAEEAWKEYRELLHDLRMSLIEAGWCFECGSSQCFGDCRDDWG